jgi:hypothetical protein
MKDAYILDNHDQEREFDAEGLVALGGARDIVRGHVRPHDFQHARLDVGVCDALDVSVSDMFVPDLQWFRPENQRGQRQLPKVSRRTGWRGSSTYPMEYRIDRKPD